MENIVRLHRRIAPELMAVVEERYHILRQILYSQPVGRRALAASLAVGERIVRAQVDFLKSAGLVDFSPLGMTITQDGKAILVELAGYIRLLHGLTSLEAELAAKLGMELVIIPGNSDIDGAVRKDLGRSAAAVLARWLGEPVTVAVSGGSTTARMAQAFADSFPRTLVVPARGALGEEVEYQANTVAAVLAGKLGGRYRLLHMPDAVSDQALAALLDSDANIRDMAAIVGRADIVVYGVGQAERMAVRRRLSPALIGELLRRGAVGESLGDYCTLDGEIVYATAGIGLRLKDLSLISRKMMIAGGAKKAAAIVAVANAGGGGMLVTDEAAARAIQAIVNNPNK
ncbi:MAG: sugar-binding domain-containing protein [Sporomusaceae bacterium]|nr:sugar-binding domain-containing protein [Sporomusaceae bacterium]